MPEIQPRPDELALQSTAPGVKTSDQSVLDNISAAQKIVEVSVNAQKDEDKSKDGSGALVNKLEEPQSGSVDGTSLENENIPRAGVGEATIGKNEKNQDRELITSDGKVGS